MPDGRAGECIEFTLCRNGSIITDGSGNYQIDYRFGEDPCGDYNICCWKKGLEPILKKADVPDGCGYRNVEGLGLSIKDAPNNQALEGNIFG